MAEGIILTGTEVNDALVGSVDDDQLSGLAGNDTLEGGFGADTLDGGEGADLLFGGGGGDSLLGGLDGDQLSGEGGDDHLDGGDGADVLSGGTGSDTILGGLGHDFLSDNGGSGVIDGGDGNDGISGALGLLQGGLGEDLIFAFIPVGGGEIRLEGGEGADRFRAFLTPGGTSGAEVEVAGGGGVDTFTLGTNSSPTLPENVIDLHWRVEGFEAGAGGDLIDVVNNPSSAGLLELSAALGYSGGNPFAEEQGFLRLLQSGADTLLQWDPDGVAGEAYGWNTLMTLVDIDHSTVTSDNFVSGIDPDGGVVDGETLTGGAGNDSLKGGIFADH